MKCEVIKDLAPLYKDKLTCDVTNTEIENHLGGCDDCNKFYNGISADDLVYENIKYDDENGVNILKKVRNRNVFVISSAILSIVIMILWVLISFYIGMPVNSNDVEIGYYSVEDDTGFAIYASFKLNNGNVILMKNSAFSIDSTARQYIRNPFNEQYDYSMGYALYKNDDGVYVISNSKVDFKFADKIVTIDFKDVADKLGIEYVTE